MKECQYPKQQASCHSNQPEQVKSSLQRVLNPAGRYRLSNSNTRITWYVVSSVNAFFRFGTGDITAAWNRRVVEVIHKSACAVPLVINPNLIPNERNDGSNHNGADNRSGNNTTNWYGAFRWSRRRRRRSLSCRRLSLISLA
jgi:hypothetical protein